MGTAIIERSGIPAGDAFDALIEVIRSDELRALTRSLVSGQVADSVDGVAEISAQATLDSDVWNLILRNPNAARRVVITVRALEILERAMTGEADDRDPKPPPFQWRTATEPVTRWELFNCEVVRIALRS